MSHSTSSSFLPSYASVVLIAAASASACAGEAEPSTDSADSNFTGYETLPGYSQQPFLKDFSPALLLVESEMLLRQGRSSMLIGSAYHQAMCTIANDNGGNLTKYRDYVFSTNSGFAILAKDVEFTRYTAPGEADVPTVRVRLRGYDPYGRKVGDLTKFTLYCKHSQFDPVQAMPTAAAIVTALSERAPGSSDGRTDGTWFKFVPSSADR